MTDLGSASIAVLGAGSWGTALAYSLSANGGHDVRLWARRRSLVESINEHRRNVDYLPEVELPRRVLVTADLRHALEGCRLVVFATPSQTVRAVARPLADVLGGDHVVVSVAKGIEVGTLLTTTGVLRDVLVEVDPRRIGVLYGPSHAEEVGAGQPTAVLCDVDVLDTLPDREFTEGLGEVVKCGLIADPVILDLIESVDGKVRDHGGVVVELVRRSVEVKARIVGEDEREGASRAFLNFGHTYGHVVETLTGYGEVLHGEAVAIGMVVALRLGERLGSTPAETVQRAEAALTRVGLPTAGPILDRDQVWDVMARDKKAGRDGVRFVVLDGLGAPRVVNPTRADVDAVLAATQRT